MADLSVNDQLVDKMVSHQIGLTRITRQLIKEITDLLNQADRQILDAIEARAKFDGTITFSRIDAILKDIAKANTEIYNKIEADIQERLQELAKYEMQYQINAIGNVIPFDVSIDAVSDKLLNSIVDKETFNGASLSEWVEGMKEGRYVRIRNAVRQGVVNDEDIRSILGRIEGTASRNYLDGVLNVSRRSLASILRTATNHVSSAVRGAIANKNDDVFDGEQWVSTLDDATTDYCEEQDGEVYPLDQGPRPPAHINCRSQMVPVIMSAEDMGFDNQDLPEHVLKLVNGKPAEKLKYGKWLAKQSIDTQIGILGLERTNLFRAGKLKVHKFVDHVGTAYTIKELKAIEMPKSIVPPSKAIKAIQIKKNFGWKPDLPDLRDLLYSEAHPGDQNVPRAVSWRLRMSPVFDQGDLGSCTANALVSLLMFVHGAKTPMLSRLQLYWNERFIEDSVKADSGAEIRDGIKVLSKIGICTEDEWPYKIKKFKLKPPLPVDDADYRIGKYSRLKTHDDFTKCLASGFPFVGGFTVYSNFDSELASKFGILTLPSIQDKQVGGHAVCIVGYDQDFHSNPVFKKSGLPPDPITSFMYEVRNSYGSDWGDEGYFWIPASYLEDRNLSDDFWTIRQVGKIAVALELANNTAYMNRLQNLGFNPNHDEHGKFASGGGGSGISHEEARDFADKVCADLDFDSSRVDVVAGTRQFEVNGVTHTAAGDADISKGEEGRIRLYADHLNTDSVAAVTAHEIEHEKFQAALDAYSRDSAAIQSDPGPAPDPDGKYWWQRKGGIDAIMSPDGSLKFPYDEKYSNYQAMHESLYAHDSSEFAKGDGVSSYSAEYWKAFLEGSVSYHLAVHETLAEMSRIKYTTGKFPEHYGYSRLISERNQTRPATPDNYVTKQSGAAEGTKLWRDLFRTTERVYKRRKKR